MLSQILENLPDIVLVVGRDETIHYINHVEPGYDRDEVLGTHWLTFIFPEAWERPQEAYAAIMAGGEPEEFETKVHAADGGQLWFHSRMSQYREEDEIVGVVIVATNVTELKAAQERLHQLQQLLSVCSWCGRIRNEDGGWDTITTYLEKKEDSAVSHGICPDCQGRQIEAIEG